MPAANFGLNTRRIFMQVSQEKRSETTAIGAYTPVAACMHACLG